MTAALKTMERPPKALAIETVEELRERVAGMRGLLDRHPVTADDLHDLAHFVSRLSARIRSIP